MIMRSAAMYQMYQIYETQHLRRNGEGDLLAVVQLRIASNIFGNLGIRNTVLSK